MKFSLAKVLAKIVSASCLGDFCNLLITFANSLDPDQARQLSGLI